MVNFQYFYNQIQDVDELRVVLGSDQNIESNAFSQVVLSIDETKVNKKMFRETLNRNGIFNSDANFRPINTMDYFRQQKYRNRMPHEIANRLDDITSAEFINATKVYKDKGIGLSRINFESSLRVKSLVKNIKSAISDL
jgi:dTDP-4-amino-4,6-dideoxygalactose transaminase